MARQVDHKSVSEYSCDRGVCPRFARLFERETHVAIAGSLEALWNPHPVQDKIMSIADKRRAFRALHQSGCFVIPNPWNVGSARYMQGLGFKALATTSSGFAHSIG